MRCHSVGCGMASQTQSDTRCTAAAHIYAVIRVYDEAGNVIETHEHVGDFKDAVIPARFTKCSDF
jgi:hypothetical protein